MSRAPDRPLTAQAGSRPLSGQTAIVTGAARGVGASIADRLACEGASVVVADGSCPSGKKESTSCLLGGGSRGDGNAVLGRSVQEAVVLAVFLDESARLQYQARALGAPASATSTRKRSPSTGKPSPAQTASTEPGPTG